MTKKPFDAQQAIKDLLAKAKELNATESSLDDLVHDICSGMASDVNNRGLEHQITFIITHSGPQGINEITNAISQ